MLTSTSPRVEAAKQTTFDEVAEAMNNGRQLAASLRLARSKRDQFASSITLHAAAAMRETIANLVDDLRSIAARAFIDIDVLICLLDEEDRVRTSFRRKPTFDQLKKSVARRIAETERELMAMHEAAAAAQQKVERATRDRIAAGGAGQLFGIAA